MSLVRIPVAPLERELRKRFSFLFLCSFILRCRADDIRRLVGLVYDGLCASPHHHSQSQSLRLRSTSSNNNEVVCCPRIAHIMLVEPIIENLLLRHSPCAIMYRLYCFAVRIPGGTTKAEDAKLSHSKEWLLFLRRIW